MNQATSKAPGRHTPLTLSQTVSGKSKPAKSDKIDDAEKPEVMTVKPVKSSPKIKVDDSSSTKSKSDDKPKENVASTDKEPKISNGAQNGAGKENGSTDDKKVRESSRQKSGPNKDADGAKSNNESLKEKRSETPKKFESTEKSDKSEKSSVTTPNKTDSAKNTETNKKSATEDEKTEKKKEEKKDANKDENTKVDNKKQETQAKKDKESSKKLDSPKTVKTDTVTPSQKKRSDSVWDDQDMEPLMMEIDIDNEIHKSTPTPSRVLRLKGGPSLSTSSSARASRLSPYRAQNNTSTMVNVSAGSEPSTASSSNESKTPIKIPEESFTSGIRNISGRRTFRPMREMSFQNSYRTTETYRESYRKLNDSVSSMNATMGSEINYDSLRTPVLHSARKRDRLDNDEHYEPVVEVESPKRARIDFTGFIGFMASPVTMLRDRLSRSRIQSSTPRKMDINDDIMIDTVSASNIEDEKIIDDDEDDVVEVKDENDAVDPSKDVGIDDAELIKMKKENTLEGIDVPTDAVVITEVAEKKRNCNIM